MGRVNVQPAFRSDDADGGTIDRGLDIVPRRLDLGVPRLNRQLEQLSVQHTHYAHAAHAEWSGYSSQRHVRALAVDPESGRIWAGTWGGVLCWDPSQARVTRHTSAHGLAGNPTRALVVDDRGDIWAAGEALGLSWLAAGLTAAWQPVPVGGSWKVLSLAARPGGGVYLGLSRATGCALGELDSYGAPLRLLAMGGLACRTIAALVVQPDGTLWIGNGWGAHRYGGNGTFSPPQLADVWVRAMAVTATGQLWAGTSSGVYRLAADGSWIEEEGCPRDEVLALAADPTGSLCISTPRQVGRLVNGSWRPLCTAPSRHFHCLVAERERAWAGGAGGLYLLDEDECRPAFAMAAEDNLANAIQTLRVHDDSLWVGTARALFILKGDSWHSYEQDAPALRDIRDLAPGHSGTRLWVGGYRGGLSRIEYGVYVPSHVLPPPIVALASGGAGQAWAASPDRLYCQADPQAPWIEVNLPARTVIGTGAIQVLCYQPDKDVLWVGTSAGLHQLSIGLDLWNPDRGSIEPRSIQALALDPASGLLWIGTNEGLFGEEEGERPFHRGDIRALAFAPMPFGDLWLGTTQGLERWRSPARGEVFAGAPLGRFDAASSGLAGNLVTSVICKAGNGSYDVWAGSSAGLSRLTVG